jgi:hypothetical protein
VWWSTLAPCRRQSPRHRCAPRTRCPGASRMIDRAMGRRGGRALILTELLCLAVFVPAPWCNAANSRRGHLCRSPLREWGSRAAEDSGLDSAAAGNFRRALPKVSACTACPLPRRPCHGGILRLRGGALDNTRYYDVLKLPVGEEDENVRRASMLKAWRVLCECSHVCVLGAASACNVIVACCDHSRVRFCERS